MAITPADYDKALMGRINVGRGLISKEKEIAKKVPPNKDIKESYTWERLRTNPYVKGLGAAVITGGVLYGGSKAGYKLLEKGRAAQQAFAELPSTPGRAWIKEWAAKFPQIVRDRLTITPEQINRMKNVSPKTIVTSAAGTGATTAFSTYVNRHHHANELMDQSKDPARSYIRTKLAEFPIALLDDAAIYGMRAIEPIERELEMDKKKTVKKVSDKAEKVMKKISMLEKNAGKGQMFGKFLDATGEVISHAKKGVGELVKYPAATLQTGFDSAKKDLEHWSAGAIDSIQEAAKSPLPGSTEAAAGYHIVKGGVDRLVAGAKKYTRPLLQKAKDTIMRKK